MIRRNVEAHIENHLTNPKITQVLLISGARQVGKTTLVNQILSRVAGPTYKVNLERTVSFRDQIDQTTSFEEFELLLKGELNLENNRAGILFIDEAQESKKLGSYIRFMKEEWKCKVILTGSSMTRLFNEESRIPVGRFKEILVTPFNFEEFLLAKKDTALLELFSTVKAEGDFSRISPIFHQRFLAALDQYLEVGGLPEVVSTFFGKGDWQGLRREVVAAQKDDFLRKSKISEAWMLSEALASIANHLGYPSKFSQIAESLHKAKVLTSQLRDWKLIYQIEQKGTANTTQFTPKRYLYDHGVAQMLRTAPFPQLSLVESLDPVLRGPLGGLFESMTLSQIVSQQAHLEDISGWKKNAHSDTEVDLVWRIGRKTIPIECKSSLKIAPRNFSALKSYLELSGMKLGVSVSLAPYSELKQDGLTLVNIPLYLMHPEVLLNLK